MTVWWIVLQVLKQFDFVSSYSLAHISQSFTPNIFLLVALGPLLSTLTIILPILCRFYIPKSFFSLSNLSFRSSACRLLSVLSRGRARARGHDPHFNFWIFTPRTIFNKLLITLTFSFSTVLIWIKKNCDQYVYDKQIS